MSRVRIAVYHLTHLSLQTELCLVDLWKIGMKGVPQQSPEGPVQ